MPEDRKGGFFSVPADIWARVCSMGINEATAYLVLSQGTSAGGQSTSWSIKALHRYSGVTVERGKLAIGNLVKSGVIFHNAKHTIERPRYDLSAPSKPKRKVDQPKNLIWLPNTLITGTADGEPPPIKRLRRAGEIWALRLLIDLYAHQNLRDDGGIAPWLIRGNFDRLKVGEFGPYNIWAFKGKNQTLWAGSGPFTAHNVRPEVGEQSPIWDSIEILRHMGLLSFVPHIWDNDPGQGSAAAGEILHPFGLFGIGESLELQISQAANAAALRVSIPDRIERASDDGYNLFCPIPRTIPNACMVGVARLRYRPHTKRTGTWFGELEGSAPGLISGFNSIGAIRGASDRERVG